MMVNGIWIGLVVMAFTNIKMVPFIKANGKMTYSMVMDMRNGLMDLLT